MFEMALPQPILIAGVISGLLFGLIIIVMIIVAIFKFFREKLRNKK